MSIQTICRVCEFAEFEQGKQTGCQQRRLEKFSDKELVEENGLTFYRINRYCNLCRCGEEYRGRAAEIRAEETIKVDLIIVAGKDNYEYDIVETLTSALAASVKPASVNVLCLSSININYDDLFKNLKARTGEVVLRVVRQIQEVPINLLNHVVRNINGPYYCVFNAGFHVPPDFLLKFDQIVNDECEQVALIEGDDFGNGDIVNLRLHKQFSGDIESLKEYLRINECLNLIKPSLL